MARVTWTPQALDDLDAACAYIARDAPRVAEVFACRVFKVAERLEQFPLSGRIVPEMDVHHLREVIVGSYRLVYRLEQEEVEILTLYHGARLLTDCHADLV